MDDLGGEQMMSWIWFVGWDVLLADYWGFGLCLGVYECMVLICFLFNYNCIIV